MDPLYITIETVKTAAKYVVGKLFDAIGEAVYTFIRALMEQEEIAEPEQVARAKEMGIAGPGGPDV